ncbi:MAG: hypothetical protein ACRYGM_12110 [Janthinobacterium lividum]
MPASLGVGVAALLCIALLAAVSTGPVMPSYLAAWLFWLALPAGALPLVMAFDLAAVPAPAAAKDGSADDGHAVTQRLPLFLLPALRLLLVLLPLVALLAIPVLLAQYGLFGTAASRHGFAVNWYSPGARALRAVAVLLVWSALALLFLRPGRPRVLAALGLVVHLFAGTLLAMDLAMSVAPGLGSTAYGLLLIASQCGIAFSAAVLLAGLPMFAVSGPTGLPRRDAAATLAGPMPGSVIATLLWLLAAWMFLQFNQYLVVWSANLPREIVWYQQRDNGLGRAAEWFAALAFLVPLLAATVPRFARDARVLAGLAVLVLLMHLVEMLWLITPSFRGAFTLSLADLLGLTGIGGVSCALLLLVRGRSMGLPA